jgi:hypothetical protein
MATPLDVNNYGPTPNKADGMTPNYPPNVGQTRRDTITGATFDVLDWDENRGNRGMFMVDSGPSQPQWYTAATLVEASAYVSGPAYYDGLIFNARRVARAAARAPACLDAEGVRAALRAYVAPFEDRECPNVGMLGYVLSAIVAYEGATKATRDKADEAKPVAREHRYTFASTVDAVTKSFSEIERLAKDAKVIDQSYVRAAFGIPEPVADAKPLRATGAGCSTHTTGKAGTTLDRDTLAAEWLAKHGTAYVPVPGADRGPAGLAKAAYEFADAMIRQAADVPDDVKNVQAIWRGDAGEGQPAGRSASDPFIEDLLAALTRTGEPEGAHPMQRAAEAILRLLSERNEARVRLGAEQKRTATHVAYARAYLGDIERKLATTFTANGLRGIVAKTNASLDMIRVESAEPVTSILKNVACCHATLADANKLTAGLGEGEPFDVDKLRRYIVAAMACLDTLPFTPHVDGPEPTEAPGFVTASDAIKFVDPFRKAEVAK